MDIIIATVIGSVIVFTFMWLISKIPMEPMSYAAILVALLLLSFMVGSLVTDWLNITDFYKEI